METEPRGGTGVRSFSRVLALGLSVMGGVGACGHSPPYARGQAPAVDTLLKGTEPQLEAIAVPDASITINRVAKGELAFLAQAPDRFRGTVSKSGQELLTLALYDGGYRLRYQLGGHPPGYYAGPPSLCAVEALLGVPLSYEGLVALVLGGAPVLEAPVESLGQRWYRRGGYESIRLANDRYEQELRFAYVEGRWVFTGAVLWQRIHGRRGAELWTLEHEAHRVVGHAVLPGRTRVRARRSGRNQLVTIEYNDRELDPAWGDESGSDTWGDEGGDWEDDRDWEDGEANVEAPITTVEESTQPAEPPRIDAVPAVFVIDGDGLPYRGDLCRP